MSKRNSYRAGFATRDITHLEPGALLMGWADDRNRATGIGTRLLARAMVVTDPSGEAVAYACAELAFVDVYLREKVIERLARTCEALGLGDHNVMLSATHTHSGPAGASPYLLYNISNPGFSQPLFDHLVDGLAGAIEAAAAALAPAQLRLTTVEIPDAEPVAFNRSLAAYNRNPDVMLRRPNETHLAVDRTMTLLLATSPKGKPLGSLNWFGLHNTSVHFDQGLLHHDNKGVAAALHEAEMRAQNPDFVSIFAQASCGDVSPNYRYDSRRGLVIGRFDDDYESAAFAGAVQHRAAAAGWAKSTEETELLRGPCGAATVWGDFGNTAVAERFAEGHTGARTRSPRNGLTMLQGTEEGPGPLLAFAPVPRLLNAAAGLRHGLRRRLGRISNAPSERFGAQFPFMELGASGQAPAKVFGLFSMATRLLPTQIDPTVKRAKELRERGALMEANWVPRRMPVQVMRIGSLAIVGVPLEPSTVAGRRVQKALLEQLRSEGISTVICNGHANGYAGYAVTPQEYLEQAYEGASTCFGRWTLGAVQTLAATAAGLMGQKGERSLHHEPIVFDEAFLQAHASPHARPSAAP
jgi:neutral ceramidase